MTIPYNPSLPECITFDTEEYEREKFEQWILRVKPRLMHLAAVVGRCSRTEVQKGRQEDLIAHLDNLLEDLSNISLEVKELEIRAREYYQAWLADETEMQMNNLFGETDSKGKPKKASPKTVQDYCVKLNSPQKRILERMSAMSNTVTMRISVCQTMLRSLKP